MANLNYNFDHLDSLMDDAGLDVLLVTSKHNVQYLLGGYKFLFFFCDGCHRSWPVPASHRVR